MHRKARCKVENEALIHRHSRKKTIPHRYFTRTLWISCKDFTCAFKWRLVSTRKPTWIRRHTWLEEPTWKTTPQRLWNTCCPVESLSLVQILQGPTNRCRRNIPTIDNDASEAWEKSSRNSAPGCTSTFLCFKKGRETSFSDRRAGNRRTRRAIAVGHRSQSSKPDIPEDSHTLPV